MRQLQATLTQIFIVLESESHGLSDIEKNFLAKIGNANKFKRFFTPKTGDLKKKDLHRNSEEFFGQNRKFKQFFSPKTGDLQKKGLHRNSEEFFGQNRKFKRFFSPKTGDLQKKKRSSPKFRAKIGNLNGFLYQIAASASQLRHPNSFGGGCFHFSAKIGLKITKNVPICILYRPMGGLEPSPSPGYATVLST